MIADFDGSGSGDQLRLLGFGTAAQGATLTQVGSGNQWQIHSAIDGHNEVITLTNHAQVHASDVVLVASGTATLETALLERPMVIVYRVTPLTYALARRLVSVPFIGMPNLIAGRAVVPELVQDDVPVRPAEDLLV